MDGFVQSTAGLRAADGLRVEGDEGRGVRGEAHTSEKAQTTSTKKVESNNLAQATYSPKVMMDTPRGVMAGISLTSTLTSCLHGRTTRQATC